MYTSAFFAYTIYPSFKRIAYKMQIDLRCLYNLTFCKHIFIVAFVKVCKGASKCVEVLDIGNCVKGYKY